MEFARRHIWTQTVAHTFAFACNVLVYMNIYTICMILKILVSAYMGGEVLF